MLNSEGTSRIRSIRATIAVLLVLGAGAPYAAASAIPPEVAAAAASSGISPLLAIARDLFEVPAAAAEMVYLPMGMVESTFFALPGLELKRGLTNTGRGMVAPFKFAYTVLVLPKKLVDDMLVIFKGK